MIPFGNSNIKILLIVLLIIFLSKGINVSATDSSINHNPKSYVHTKFKTQNIVLLGTRHKQTPILNFIPDLITALQNSGVSYIGLEIEPDQQAKIDQFIKTGDGLNDISIHPQIDCPEYRNLFNVIRGVEANKRPALVALDLPKSKYGDNISRDEWMAESIAGVFARYVIEKIHKVCL
jgi:hypothetical protein